VNCFISLFTQFRKAQDPNWKPGAKAGGFIFLFSFSFLFLILKYKKNKNINRFFKLLSSLLGTDGGASVPDKEPLPGIESVEGITIGSR